MSNLTRDSDEIGELPDYICPECTTLRFAGEPTCSVCATERPEQGWKPLEQAYDPFLGCVLDGRYLVVKKEGKGASASVYRGKRITDDRAVALKISRVAGRGEAVEDYVRERMAREVEAVGKLDNPHIVPIYEFLELDTGPSVIVMDFVDGVTTSKLTDDRDGLEVPTAVSLAEQAADCLADAHDAGLIHRDIKPENIMVEREDEEFVAYLLDFGIVRVHEATSGLTQGFIGTPLFTSPEQACMDDVDFRTDIYSLGTTIYYWLTGRAPFDRPDVDDVMKAQVTTEVEPLEEAVEPVDVPADLERLVHQMLEKRPEDRPDSMDDVAAQLAWMSDEIRSRRKSGSFDAPRDSAPKTPTGTVQGVQAVDDQLGGFADRAGSGVDTSDIGPSTGEYEAVDLASETVAADEQLEPADDGEASGEGRRMAAQKSVAFLSDEQQRDLEAHTSDLGADGGSSPQQPVGIDDVAAAAVGGDRDTVVADRSGEIVRLPEGSAAPTVLTERDVAAVDVAVARERIYAAFPTGTVCAWDREETSVGAGETVYEAAAGNPVTAVGADATGDRVVVGLHDGRILGRRGPQERWSEWPSVETVLAADFASDGSCFGIAGEIGRFVLFDADDADSDGLELDPGEELADVAVSSDGQLAAVLTGGGSAVVYHVKTGRVVTERESLEAELVSIYFSPSDELRGVSTAQHGLALWDCVRDTALVTLLEGEYERA